MFLHWLPVLRLALETQTQILQHRSKCADGASDTWLGFASVCTILGGREEDEMRCMSVEIRRRGQCVLLSNGQIFYSL